MPTEYTVVGENREDESQLLVMGEDGNYYSYVPARELLSRIDPDDTWVIMDGLTPDLPRSSDPGFELM